MRILPLNHVRLSEDSQHDNFVHRMEARSHVLGQFRYLSVKEQADYPTISAGGLCRLGIDKIMLEVDRRLLVVPEALKWLDEGPIHFLRLGGRFYFCVNMEWMPQIHHTGIRVLWGLMEMARRGVFLEFFSFQIRYFASYCQADLLDHSLWATGFITTFLKLVEWEMAMDFYRMPLILYFSEDELYGFNRVGGNIYSKDFREIFHWVSGVRKLQKRQCSILKIYNWQEKHGGHLPCWRLEFRFQGKYRKDLDDRLLVGGVLDAFWFLLPSMTISLRQVTTPAHLVFHGHWLLNGIAPWWFKALLEKSQWHDFSKITVPRPRRAKRPKT